MDSGSDRDSDVDVGDSSSDLEDHDGAPPSAGSALDDGVMAGLTDMEIAVSEEIVGVDVLAEQLRTVAGVLETLVGDDPSPADEGAASGSGLGEGDPIQRVDGPDAYGRDQAIASVASDVLDNDFDPMYFVRTHPMSFPHGTGHKPASMSLKYYARLLTERQIGRPAAEGGEDVPLTLTLFNVTQRHSVLEGTKNRMSGQRETFEQLDGITSADAASLLTAAARGAWPVPLDATNSGLFSRCA
jgi:hypothetical protein